MFNSTAKRLFLISISALTLLPRSSEACSCVGPVSVQADYDSADVVFLGKVIEIREEVLTSIIGEEDHVFTAIIKSSVSLEVLQSWKGIDSARTVLIEEPNPATCFPLFVVGEDFLVYASANSDSSFFETDICRGTRAICSEYDPGLPDVHQFNELGIPPLLQDGLSMIDVESRCEPVEEDESDGDTGENRSPNCPDAEAATGCGAFSPIRVHPIWGGESRFLWGASRGPVEWAGGPEVVP